MKELLKSYEERREEIRRRLLEFQRVWKKPDERIFAELCFCLCTPQSSAKVCNAALEKLEKTGMLYKADQPIIEKNLKGVRFRRNKARYIVEARKLFTHKGRLNIKPKIRFGDPVRIREWLVENVKGLGYKEASHFLRNIGLGENLAILDRHILKNLLALGVIDEIPKTLTKKRYLEIEKKARKFARKIGIPLAELDLLLWSKETGFVFK